MPRHLTTSDRKIPAGQLAIDGEQNYDLTHRVIYSTDASAYDQRPVGVIYPMNTGDIRKAILFAAENKLSLIPRATGTSLAGQVVGDGLVMDISRHLNAILEVNAEERWVRVQPGVVLDELNIAIKPYGLFFSPETSTSNRCCVGGMTGNNSCGSHSVIYGSVRDHLLEAKVVLADGSEAVFKALTPDEAHSKTRLDNMEGDIYRAMIAMLTPENVRKSIHDNYPDPSLRRRNTGYALDKLASSTLFDRRSDHDFNLCDILAGSEGTLAFITELKLSLDPLPPAEKAVVCIHCRSLAETFDANLVALAHHPSAVELIDNTILHLSKKNITQSRNNYFVEGDPAALLVVELDDDTPAQLKQHVDALIADMRGHGMGYAYPVLTGSRIQDVWNLRKAGLGLLSGIPGSAKPVPVIEDTAVAPVHLKQFHQELKSILDGYGLSSVYYAHIGSGELHLRPILDLKNERDRNLFRQVALDTAHLVRKYRGSMSGEHGDGRLRGEFIPIILGTEVFNLIRRTKNIFDPDGIFNRGKIVDTPPMNEHLRARHSELDNMSTYFDFDERKGYLNAIEQCNGSGDCRKARIFGGVMCPSFRATRHETHTTRARANMLRELLINPAHAKVFSQPEILAILSTCLMCKGCKAECPSNVDMTRLKAEYLQHHYDESGVPLRTRLVSMLPQIQRLGMLAPAIYNAMVSSSLSATLLKRMMGFAHQRDIPGIYRHTLKHWLRHHPSPAKSGRRVYIFADEFTDYEDVQTGICFVELLRALGYDVRLPEHVESGRINLSKGLLKRARKSACENVRLLRDVVSGEAPLVGIEPSCILSFRDEYPDLVGAELRDDARRIARNALLYDEFIVREIDAGRITPDSFTDLPADIILHGHCHQKALASVEASKRMLSLPRNYKVDVIPSGCCGMAGAFGYSRDNYELSMRIGEEVLFPAVRSASAETLIAAPGTSCRHQIKDGTGRSALHPVTILYRALNDR